MAPTLFARASGALGTDDTGARVAIIIIIITLASLALLSVLVVLVIRVYKRRQYGTLPQPNPSMSSLESAQRPKDSKQVITEHEEQQRLVMIRKSLASRTSTLIDSQSSQRSDEDLDTGDESSSRPGSLRSDWKEFEANIQTQRSASMENHPVLRNTPENLCESCGRVSPPAMAELPRHSPTARSTRSSVSSPAPVAPISDTPPYSRQLRSSWQRTPPQRGTAFEPLRGSPPRAKFDPSTPFSRRGTFDAVPEEYCSVPLNVTEKPGPGWI